MRDYFIFDSRLHEIANTIKDDWKRLEFYEAIINYWINDKFPEVQGLWSELSKAMLILMHTIHVSTVRSEAWKKWNKSWNKNATKENTTKRLSQKQDSTHTQITEKKKLSNQQKHDENVDLLDKVKAKVESLWLVYKWWSNERISATNIRKAKKFKEVAERFNMTSEQLALAVIEASMSDKFRSWKINNCDMIYRHYDKIINEANMKQAQIQNSIWFLPWA